MSELFVNERDHLVLPFMEKFYSNFAEPYGWVAFRVIIGGMLAVEGWPKILSPFSQVGFVEALGFHPGWFFSPLLAVVQVIGGLMIVFGVLTRPAALANAIMLLVTLWYHFAHPYGDAFLTADGIAYLAQHKDLLTAAGQHRLLADGGAGFLEIAMTKAEQDSLFWAAGAALIAAFGGGPLSVDKKLKKEF